ncbi:hypothetical protein ACFWAY_47520 [Rhodococcus sp. NPDC059968]
MPIGGGTARDEDHGTRPALFENRKKLDARTRVTMTRAATLSGFR